MSFERLQNDIPLIIKEKTRRGVLGLEIKLDQVSITPDNGDGQEEGQYELTINGIARSFYLKSLAQEAVKSDPFTGELYRRYLLKITNNIKVEYQSCEPEGCDLDTDSRVRNIEKL